MTDTLRFTVAVQPTEDVSLANAPDEQLERLIEEVYRIPSEYIEDVEVEEDA